MPRNVRYVAGSSRRICQLTGEFDRAEGENRLTVNRTGTRFGLRGTDLGASFEHKGRCWFLFGDTHPTGPNNAFRPFDGDAIAYTRDKRPGPGLRLDFVTASDGKYLAPSAPGISMKGFEVPTGGFSADGAMYVFFTTDVRFRGKDVVMGRSVLLRSNDDGKSFQTVYTVSQDKIIYIAPAMVNNTDWPGLPDSRGRGLLLWSASTEYRRSDPYLAYLPLARLQDRSAMRYFAGRNPRTDQPEWSERESDAVSLFSHPQIGELCVSWNPYLKQWLLLYNSGKPRGIVFRVSDTPWGPWTDSALLFDPWLDKGYGHFMHISSRAKNTDTLSDPGREVEWGGEYAPYIVDRFTTGKGRRTTIYYVLSTWNPYNTVLMEATLEAEN